MKKILCLIIAIFLLLPLMSAINVDVKQLSDNEVLVVDLGKPVIFELEMTNRGDADYFEFYNLLGFTMHPIGTTYIGEGQSKKIEMSLLPIGDFSIRGNYNFNYYIRGQEGTNQQKQLIFRVIDFADVFEIGSGEVDSDSNSIEVYIQNMVNFNFGEINAEFSSAFFDLEESFELGPNEKVSFTVQLDKADFNQLIAGFYTLQGKITSGNKEANMEGIIKFVEQENLISSEENYGFIINTNIITKINEGNMVEEFETIIKKNIFSRLFTSFSPEPDSVERRGGVVYYTWAKGINPGESFEIIVRTNWIFPFLIIFFIVAIVIFVKQSTRTHLVLRKRVQFVKAKGGEFALKVSVFVNAKQYVERVSIVDRLPPLVKIFNRFSGDMPSKVDEKTRKIEWNFEKLEAGETRMLNYIIYSKIGVLGKFVLPSSIAIYERDGKMHEAQSNRAFFVAEQSGKDIEE